MTSEKTETRRRYSAAMKAQVVAACDEPGASVAKVAMARGINANVVHRWRQLSREGKAAPTKSGEFIALPLTVASETAPASAASLTQSLNAARATGSYERKLATLARVPLLIIDDFGLKPLRAPADEDLHDLIAERYEQAATIVTSNLDFTEWDHAFPANRLLASASLDRLRHNAHCLVLDGQSYRAPKQLPTADRPAPQETSKSTAA